MQDLLQIVESKALAYPCCSSSYLHVHPLLYCGVAWHLLRGKGNKLFVGQVIQLGFAASLIDEVFTGKRPVTQFDVETGIPIQDTEFGLVVFLFAAINEGSGRFVDDDAS
jgi:hypothetical protein